MKTFLVISISILIFPIEDTLVSLASNNILSIGETKEKLFLCVSKFDFAISTYVFFYFMRNGIFYKHINSTHMNKLERKLDKETQCMTVEWIRQIVNGIRFRSILCFWPWIATMKKDEGHFKNENNIFAEWSKGSWGHFFLMWWNVFEGLFIHFNFDSWLQRNQMSIKSVCVSWGQINCFFLMNDF